MNDSSFGKSESEVPSDISQAGPRKLEIEWKDDHVSTYPVVYLRYHCPCAHCVDEVTGERRLEAGAIPGDIQPVRIESVGNYAIRIEWDDGHDTGIYAFEYLRELCPCSDCRDLDIDSIEDLPGTQQD